MPQLQQPAVWQAREALLGDGFNSIISGLFPPATPPEQPRPPTTPSSPQQTPTDVPTSPTTPPTTERTTSSSTSSSTTRPTTRSSSSRTTTTRPPSSTTSTPMTTTSDSTMIAGGSTVVVQVTQTLPPVVVAASNEASTSSSGSSNGGLIGGVVGGLALLTAIVGLLILLKRRKARTGHAWFFCFGRKPRSDQGEGEWPTFDPNQPSLASAAGTQPRKGAEPNPTLPPGFVEASSGEYGAMGAAGAAGAYSAYASRSRQESNGQMSDAMYSHGPLSNAGPTSHGGPSDDGHFPLPIAHSSVAGSNHAGVGAGPLPPWSYAQGSPPQTSGSTGPDYAHLDPPEVRQARARQQAAAALGRGASCTAGSDIGSGTVHSIPPALTVGAASSQAHVGASDFYGAPLANAASPEKRQSIASLTALSQGNHSAPAPPYADVQQRNDSLDEVDYAVPAGTRERLHLSNPDDA